MIDCALVRETARVRISKVRFKAGGADLTLLPTPDNSDNQHLIESLVWMLAQARRGDVLGYTLVYIVDDKELGYERTIGGVGTFRAEDRSRVLGMLERHKIAFYNMNFLEDE